MLLTLWVSFFLLLKKSILPHARHDRVKRNATRPGCCHVSHKINTQLAWDLPPLVCFGLAKLPKLARAKKVGEGIVLKVPGGDLGDTSHPNWQTARQTGATSSSSSSAAPNPHMMIRENARPHSISVMSFWPSLSDGVETDPGEFWSPGDLEELSRLRRARLQREVKHELSSGWIVLREDTSDWAHSLV